MPRKGRRITITKGVYKDASGYEVRIVVGGTAYSKRMPADSTIEELKRARATLAARGHTETPKAARGTLRAAVPTYRRLTAHLATVDDLEDHLTVWCDAGLADIQRHRITARDVLEIRNQWLADGLAPKTINNRTGTLRNLYRRLDGKRAPSPCDEIDPLPVPKTPIRRVSTDVILAVDAELQRRARFFKDDKTRARFRVFVSMGKRPCEIMRAQPGDVNLDARVWVPRDAKGGFCPGVYLNDDQKAAWELFIAADAWGDYNHGNFGRVIRHAGWPKDIRPYQARHTHWITASEMGIDLADIAVGAGHTDPRMTRRMYVPVLNSRLQAMSERMDGRFQGWPVVAKSATPAKSPRTKQKLTGR